MDIPTRNIARAMKKPDQALRDLIQFVRANSEYYRDLYQHLPEDVSDLEILPTLDHTSFWSANVGNVEFNSVLTSSLLDGGIFRSGGTTSEPKVTFYSRDELHTICRQLAECTCHAGVLPGDRIANLYYNGQLYMSFLISLYAWYDSNTPYVQLPIASCEQIESMVQPMQAYEASIAMGMVTTLIRIAEWLVDKGQQMPKVHLLIFSGEPFYPDQKPLIQRAFPNAVVRPMMYGCTEGGLIGIPTNDATLDDQAGGPTYVPNSPSMIVEILDEFNQPIHEAGRKGLIHVTGVTRRLQPCIRYPPGDMGEWIDPGRQIFVLRGRSVVGFKIGAAICDFQHLREIVVATVGENHLAGFQALARRRDGKDQLVLRIASSFPETERKIAHDKFEDDLQKSKLSWAKDIEQGNISPLGVDWITVNDLYRSPRTGKLRDVVDERQ